MSPIRALWVDEGTGAGTGSPSARRDPAAAAAAGIRRRRCARHGITVRGAAGTGRRRAARRRLAGRGAVAPRSAQIVEHILEVSDNEAAEVLARQVAVASGTRRRSPAAARRCIGPARARRRPQPATDLRRQRAVPRRPAAPVDPRWRCCRRGRRRPTRSCEPCYRPAGGRVHRLAGLPVRRPGHVGGPGRGPRQDRHPDRCHALRRRRARRATATCWPSSRIADRVRRWTRCVHGPPSTGSPARWPRVAACRAAAARAGPRRCSWRWVAPRTVDA